MAYIPTKTEILPSNIAIVDERGFPLPQLVFFLLKLEASNKNISTQTIITVTAVSGSGLNADGTYSADATTHYLISATSLKDADKKLDAQLFLTQSEVNTVEAGAGLNTDGTYSADTSSHYITTATSLHNADSLLDAQLYANINRLVSITANYTVLVGNYSIMANATAGAITVTLPLASTATALTVGITKTDTTANTVNIIRSGTDLICGATSQSLLFQNEVFNFVSDGTNWQLAN